MQFGRYAPAYEAGRARIEKVQAVNDTGGVSLVVGEKVSVYPIASLLALGVLY